MMQRCFGVSVAMAGVSVVIASEASSSSSSSLSVEHQLQAEMQMEMEKEHATVPTATPRLMTVSQRIFRRADGVGRVDSVESCHHQINRKKMKSWSMHLT
eukprot:gene452-895_t